MSGTFSADHEEAARPTILRHWVVLVASLMSVLLYLDRFCVSFAELYIQESLQLTQRDMAWFLSAFFWSYALAQVPAGWLSDRYGARIMMVIYILSWSVFTGLIGLANGIWFLIVMRVGCGLAQAGAYPTCGSLLSKWVPFTNRGTASSLVANGGRLGLVIAPPLTAYLMVMFVPSTQSSLLNDRGLLPGHEREFCQKLVPVPPTDIAVSTGPVAKTPAQRVWELLPLASREMVQARLTLSLDSGVEEANRKAIIKGLNDILRRPDFFEPGTFDGLSKPAAEAVQLLKRRKAGETLSDGEVERLNRLLLEASFPGEISKIYVAGWRPVMLAYGCLGLIVAGLFLFIFRNRPEDHPLCNAAEQQLIAAGRPTSPHAAKRGVPWLRVLSSTSLWLNSAAQIGTNIGWFFLASFLARYLYEVHHVEIITRAWMTTIPALGGVAGMLLGGPFTDKLTAALGLRWGRSLPLALTRFAAAVCYVACLFTEDPWTLTFLFAAVWFFCDLGIASLWAYTQDVGGPYVGAILGWGNMWGNLAAAVAPLVYVAVLTKTPTVEHWNSMFLVCSGAFVLAGIAALGINATIPIVPTEDEEFADLAKAGY